VTTPVRMLIAFNIALLTAVTVLSFLLLASPADASKATYSTVTINYVAAKIPGLSDAASCGQATTKRTGWRNTISYREDYEESPFTKLIICDATLRVVP
jgi:hypothetical protein